MVILQQELVGATHLAVHLGDQVADVTVPTPVTPQAFRSAIERKAVSATATARQLVQHVTLQLEQVTSSDVAPTYDVFLNVPPGEDPNKHDDRFVARLAMFGIRQESDARGSHGGGGQNFAFDITKLYYHLADLGQIDPKELRVSFVPVSPIGKPTVTVGRSAFTSHDYRIKNVPRSAGSCGRGGVMGLDAWGSCAGTAYFVLRAVSDTSC